MWDHLPVKNLLSAQRDAALRELDRQMFEDFHGGYDTDVHLDRRLEIMQQQQEGRV